MKALLIIGACLVLVQISQAGISRNGCLSKIVALNGYSAPNETQDACLLADDQVKLGLTELCSDEKDDISSHVTAYLEFQTQYKAASDAYSHATDAPTRIAVGQKVRQIERDWMLFGFRDEVDSARGELALAESHCLTARPPMNN